MYWFLARPCRVLEALSHGSLVRLALSSLLARASEVPQGSPLAALWPLLAVSWPPPAGQQPLTWGHERGRLGPNGYAPHAHLYEWR